MRPRVRAALDNASRDRRIEGIAAAVGRARFDCRRDPKDAHGHSMPSRGFPTPEAARTHAAATVSRLDAEIGPRA